MSEFDAIPETDPTRGGNVVPLEENIFVRVFDTAVDMVLRLPGFLYRLPWDLRSFPFREKLGPVIEHLDIAANKPQVLALTLMVVMSITLVFKPNPGKNKADPNGTAVRFTATLPGDEQAWRSKHARRVQVPSPRWCKQMQLFVVSKQKQFQAALAKAVEKGKTRRGKGAAPWEKDVQGKGKRGGGGGGHG